MQQFEDFLKGFSIKLCLTDFHPHVFCYIGKIGNENAYEILFYTKKIKYVRNQLKLFIDSHARITKAQIRRHFKHQLKIETD